MATHWIVQANPERYTLDGRLALAPEGLAWTLRQHAGDVQEGDVVWVWRAAGKTGRTSGIVARGRFGAVVTEEGADAFDLGDPAPADGPVRAIALDGVLPPGETLAREVVSADPALGGLAILVRPQGTVFPVTAPEAAALEALFAQAQAAVPALPDVPLPAGMTIAPLRARMEACFRSAGFWRHLDLRLAQRREALPEMQDLLRRFLSGALDLPAFRAEFDQRTRAGAWAAFGFGGLSGGMALNKLAKHLTDAAELTRVLRAVAAVPADDDAAGAQIEAMEALLEQAIRAGQATRFDLQPARVPFLLSALWHIQAPEAWPVRYDSVFHALAACGAPVSSGTMRTWYRTFRTAERAARAALALPPEVMDLVCRYDEGEVGGGTKPVGRVWAVGVGHAEREAYWGWFRDAGVVAIGGGIGDLADYPDKSAMLEALKPKHHTSDNPTRDALACWQFFDDMKPGDQVVAREGRSTVLGVGIVQGPYRYEPSSPYEYVRDVKWTWTGRITLPDKPLAIQTLVDITSRQALRAAIAAGTAPKVEGGDGTGGGTGGETGTTGGEGGGVTIVTPTPYTLEEALEGLFLDRTEMEAHLARLRRRHNLVLQGPPGTGKTFVAARIARLLTGDRTDARVRRVQFHPSYTYEHFVQGFRATETGGFELVDGPFKRLCDAAREDDRDHVLIIDEINRGNLGRVFGELLMLVEGDKRAEEWAVELAYSGAPFWVPPNVYVIGTMNTADRSLALVDYALRRRFAFATVAPAWSRTQLRAHLVEELGDAALVERLVGGMRALNQLIDEDRDLGSGFRLGHSWFCRGPRDGTAAPAWLADIVETELEPLLAEYWFDRPDALEAALGLLRWDE